MLQDRVRATALGTPHNLRSTDQDVLRVVVEETEERWGWATIGIPSTGRYGRATGECHRKRGVYRPIERGWSMREGVGTRDDQGVGKFLVMEQSPAAARSSDDRQPFPARVVAGLVQRLKITEAQRGLGPEVEAKHGRRGVGVDRVEKGVVHRHVCHAIRGGERKDPAGQRGIGQGKIREREPTFETDVSWDDDCIESAWGRAGPAPREGYRPVPSMRGGDQGVCLRLRRGRRFDVTTRGILQNRSTRRGDLVGPADRGRQGRVVQVLGIVSGD